MAGVDDILGAIARAAGATRPAPAEWEPQGPQDTAELRRIAALPRRLFDPNRYPDLTPLYAAHGGAMQLRPIQSAMLWEAEHANGLVASATVGSGKTLTTLLLPDAMRSKRAVLLVPASVRDQLLNEDIPYYGQHFLLPLGRLTIISYEALSNDEDLVALTAANPDLIICDEAHYLRDASSSRARRFSRYVRANPRVRMCFLSGTLTTRSIRDYAHFCEWALRSRSPLPYLHTELVNWAATLDAGDHLAPAGALGAWCKPFESVREAFQRRLSETPGIVITTSSSCDATLNIRAVEPPLPAPVAAALQTLATTWAVGADEFFSAMETAAAERQLAQGFYLRWDWPGGVEDDVWTIAKAGWDRAVRQYLRHNNRPGMDSPALLARAAAAGRWKDGREAWMAWSAVAHRPAPPVVVDWLSPYLVDFAVDWALARRAAGTPAIVWFENDAMGRALAARGVPAFFGGDGPALRKTRDAVIACSRPAFHKGMNLQRYSWALVLQPPANGGIWEQLLGREHRQGQAADEVNVDVVMNVPAARAAWRQAVLDATYTWETQKQPQKLLLATKKGLGK